MIRYLVFLITIAVILPLAVSHHFYYQKLEETIPQRTIFEQIQGVDPVAQAHLGRLIPFRKLFFLNFEEKKEPGIIRIGCFGDSFTYGAGVDDGDDYPSHLDRLLRKLGKTNVEVINFGNGWYGFHQVFMMWKDIGRAYDLDYVLLGPSSFQPVRDLTFCHSSRTTPFYIHSRFILSGDGVRRVSVPGKDLRERFAKYHGLIPDLSIWRYDRSTPPFLKAVIGKDRELENPFYYTSKEPLAEAKETYLRLLAEMKSHKETQFILLHQNADIVNTARKLRGGNFYASQIYLGSEFPYRAPDNHMSPIGNMAVAKSFFKALSGKKGIGGTRMFFDPLQNQTPVISLRQAAPTEPPSIKLKTDKNILAVIETPEWPAMWLTASHPRLLYDASFIPVDTRADEGALVYIRGGDLPPELFGTVRYVFPEGNIARLVVNKEFLRKKNEPSSSPSESRLNQSGDFRLTIGESTIGKVLLSNRKMTIKPMQAKAIQFQVPPSAEGRHENYRQGDTVYLSVAGDGKVLDLPVYTLRMEKVRFPEDRNTLKPFL